MVKRATIKDVADAANVSVATVSYTLNNTPGKTISQETRNRVLAVARKLQYIPNTSAQRLKSNRAKCIAVRLNHTLSMPRYHNIIQGIRSYLTTCGYSILLTTHDERGSLQGCIDACLSGQADGLIYIAAKGTGIMPKEMDILRQWNIPVSAIDCMGSVPDVSSVVYDYYSSSRNRMDVLLQNGYRKFLYIRPAYHNYKETAREQGALSVLMERNDVSVETRCIECLDEQWLHSRHERGSGMGILSLSPTIVKEVIALVKDTSFDTAVICYGREVQEVATRVLLTEYLRNPCPETATWDKRSISYHFPHTDAGIEAARALINMIEGDKQPQKKSIHPILDFYEPDLY